MKLALKLIFVAVAGITLVLAIDTFVSIRREMTLFQSNAKHDSRLLGMTVKAMLSDVLQSGGQNRVLELIHDIDAAEHDCQIRWVWLDAVGHDSFRPKVDINKLQPLMQEKSVTLVDQDASGQRCLYNYVPMMAEGKHIGALELSEPLARLDAQYRALIIQNSLILVGLATFSGFVVVVLGTAWVGRPLTLLIDKVRRIGRGDLSGPLAIPQKDEFSELAGTINTMCDRLAQSQEKVQSENAARIRTLEQLRHADRLKTVGSLASGIAHELGTPLNVISVKAKQIATRQLPEDEVTESAKIIRSQTQKMTTIVRQLLDFARHRTPEKASVDLREVVMRAVNMLMPLANKHNISLLIDDAESKPLQVHADPGQIEQVVTNLVINAIQATPKGGEVAVRLNCEQTIPWQDEDQKTCEGEHVRLCIEDHGSGIPAEYQPRIFEPFFTTKDVGNGTGLGLSIAHGIIKEHGGWIECKSEFGQGSRFSICLPLTTNNSNYDLQTITHNCDVQTSEV